MRRSITSRVMGSNPAIGWAFALVALLLLCGATLPGSAHTKSSASADRRFNGSWRQAGFDAAHTAHNDREQILSPSNVGLLTQIWASPVGAGFLFASPIVGQSRVYLGSGDGRLYAFDTATGATSWIGEQQPVFFVDSAAGGDGLVFASSLNQPLKAYDAMTGAIVWQRPLSRVRASTTLALGILYVANLDGSLDALDPATGTPIWSTPPQCCVSDQAPVVDGERVFQMRTDHTLTAYNARDGMELWSTPAACLGTFAAAGGKLFYAEYPNVIALDQATGTQLWAAPVGAGATFAAPAVANGMVFVTAANLFALNAATGEVIWTAPASSTWGPSVANGVVYASNLNGEWDAFDERDGSLLWSFTVGGTGCGGDCTNAVPVVANGVLYLAGPGQYLRAFSVNP